MSKISQIGLVLTAFVFVFISSYGTAYANHSWGNYHWARKSNPFTLKLGDNVSSAWDTRLRNASYDWTKSSVLNTSVVTGKTPSSSCNFVTGRVEVCNYKYGTTGWLGLTSILTNGYHITHATVRLNDTYFAMPEYNVGALKQLAVCHELGHTLGLGHVDEDYYNPTTASCLDLNLDPTPNQHPNSHDYSQLKTIYGHLDTFSTLAGQLSASAGLAVSEMLEDDETSADGKTPKIKTDDSNNWGSEVGHGEKGHAHFKNDLGEGMELHTFVFWEEGAKEKKNK